jgi:hypothetical protein
MFGYVTIKEVLYFRYQMAQLDFPLYCEALLEYIYMLSCIDFGMSVFNVYDPRITVKFIQTLAHALERFISIPEYVKISGCSMHV